MPFHLIKMLVLFTCLSPGIMPAAGSAEPTSDGDYNRWVDYYRQVAAEYQIQLDRPRPASLTLRREPVHVYHHPDGAGLKEHLGAMFVWHRQGRPEVIGSIWSYPHGGPGQRNIVHEFQSLSSSPLMAHRDGGLNWSPEEAGIVLKEIPDASAPAASRGLRLAQMRLLTRQFSATSNFFGKELELRLTAQPLYRYEIENDDAELIDGALFVYFMDWDPELFLLIEARRNANNETAWYYAAARFSDKSLKLKHKDAQVWTAPISPQSNHACGGPHEAFYAVHGVDLHELAPATNTTDN